MPPQPVSGAKLPLVAAAGHPRQQPPPLIPTGALAPLAPLAPLAAAAAGATGSAPPPIKMRTQILKPNPNHSNTLTSKIPLASAAAAATAASSSPSSSSTTTTTSSTPSITSARRKSSVTSVKFSAISPRSPEDAASPPPTRPTTARRPSANTYLPGGGPHSSTLITNSNTTMISSTSSSSPTSSTSATVRKTTSLHTKVSLTSSSSPPSAISPPPIASKSPVAQVSTSKVWVLPPRPKPGRKPSTDTPPTKRKAQNRAAQRAFRERRAARVVELEEMLNEVQSERDLREKQLSETLQTVSQENTELRESLNDLRNEIKKMQQQQLQALQTQQQIVQQQQQQQQQLRSRSSSQASTPVTSSPFTSAISPTSSGSSLQSYNIQKSYRPEQQLQQLQQQAQQAQQVQQQMQQYQQPYPPAYPQRNDSISNHVSPAGSGSTYPPTMNQMASPAPSVESPLDILDRILEIRLPVPNKNDAAANSNPATMGSIHSPHTINSAAGTPLPSQPSAGTDPAEGSNNNDDEEDDEGCGVCVKEDCICESLGIRPPRNHSNVTTPASNMPSPYSTSQPTTSTLATILEPIQTTAPPAPTAPISVGPSVPLKRRRDDSSAKAIPIFKRIKSDNSTSNSITPPLSSSSLNDDSGPLEMDFTAAFARPKPKKAAPTSAPPKRMSIDLPPLNGRHKPSTSLFSRENSRHSSGVGFDENNAALLLSQTNPGTPADRCGFCSDGTPCLCAESAAQDASSLADIVTDSSLPPISFGGVGSAPSSRHNSTTTDSLLPGVASATSTLSARRDSSKLPSILPVDQQGGCTGNPGTCMQCQADPMSTLFCTTLASRVSSSRLSSSRSSLDPNGKKAATGASGGGCCGGKGKAGGCCGGASKKKDSAPKASDSTPNSQDSELATLPSIDASASSSSSSTSTAGIVASGAASASATPPPPPPGTFIPCSAAYQTLSRHKDFKRVDLGKLVGRLTTRGMQVEVSSVANVLRELDRRLYD